MYRMALATICLVLPAAAQAQDEQIAHGPVPDWAVVSAPLPVPEDASGIAFISRNDTQSHLTAEGQRSYSAIRAKILHANALQLGNIAISWNPASGRQFHARHG